MKHLQYKGIPICACPQCHRVWLDAEHLPRLLQTVGPRKQEDLSSIGQSLGSMGAGIGDLFDLDDLLDVADSVFDGFGDLTD